MSVKVTTAVWDHAPNSLSSDELLALLALADYAEKDYWIAFPRVEKLANMIHCSVRKTQRILRSLMEKECIAIYDRPGHASVYRVQKLSEPPEWRERLRFNGNYFTLRKLKPSAAKPYGSLRRKEDEQPSCDEVVTPLRPSRKSTTFPTTTKKAI